MKNLIAYLHMGVTGWAVLAFLLLAILDQIAGERLAKQSKTLAPDRIPAMAYKLAEGLGIILGAWLFLCAGLDELYGTPISMVMAWPARARWLSLLQNLRALGWQIPEWALKGVPPKPPTPSPIAINVQA